jgi:hypothetical protein
VAHPGLREIEKGLVVGTKNIVVYDMYFVLILDISFYPACGLIIIFYIRINKVVIPAK